MNSRNNHNHHISCWAKRDTLAAVARKRRTPLEKGLHALLTEKQRRSKSAQSQIKKNKLRIRLFLAHPCKCVCVRVCICEVAKNRSRGMLHHRGHQNTSMQVFRKTTERKPSKGIISSSLVAESSARRYLERTAGCAARRRE